MTLARNLHGPFELFSQLLGVIVKFGGQGRKYLLLIILLLILLLASSQLGIS